MDEFTCRICLDDTLDRTDVISPCACKGSSKWVHRGCLDQWRSTHEDRAFSKCTECLQAYVLIAEGEDTPERLWERKKEFVCYLTRDIILGLILTQVLIACVGLLVWLFDYHSKALLVVFKAQAYEFWFYYLAGLTFILAISGFIFMISLLFYGREAPQCHGCCFDFYFCNTTHVGGEGCIACCGNCDGCASLFAGGGELCGPVLLFLFVALVLVGAVIAVFAGMAAVTALIDRHIHILKKQGLVKDYIVADLEPMNTNTNVNNIKSENINNINIINPLVNSNTTDSIEMTALSPRTTNNRISNFFHNTINRNNHNSTNHTISNNTAVNNYEALEFSDVEEQLHILNPSMDLIRSGNNPSAPPLSLNQQMTLTRMGLM